MTGSEIRTRAWADRGSLAMLALVCLGGLSCQRETRPTQYPVSGSVTFQGKPAVGAVVVLHRLGDSAVSLVPTGEVGDDGHFRIGTRAGGDGAPTGEYAVTVTWPRTRKDRQTGDEIVEDRLEGRFHSAKESRFKITVVEGENSIGPFVLK